MNRGARGDSLLMLGPLGPSNKKPPLLSLGESGGSMSQDILAVADGIGLNHTKAKKTAEEIRDCVSSMLGAYNNWRTEE